jgi:hypothetical protein
MYAPIGLDSIELQAKWMGHISAVKKYHSARQSKTVLVHVIQKYPKSGQTLGLWTVGMDGGWSLKLPKYLTQESRSYYRKQRFIRCVPFAQMENRPSGGRTP